MKIIQAFLLTICMDLAVSMDATTVDLLTPNPGLGEACGYDACPKTYPDKTNVHIVPSTQYDLGFFRTFYQHYTGRTHIRGYDSKINFKRTMDNIVAQLWAEPKRKFSLHDTAYFFKWWSERDETVRRMVFQLLRQGRLYFIGGGWSMSDEATTNYHAIIDHFTYSLRKLNATFLECGRPLVSWQSETYGHSREFASLMAQMGFDAHFISPISLEDELTRMNKRALDFVWRGSDDLGQDTDIYTNKLFDGCNAPPGFCFGGLCDDSLLITSTMELSNIDDRVKVFMDSVLSRQAPYYGSKNVLVVMGERLGYHDAGVWFSNIDTLIDNVRIKSAKYKAGLNIFYSTPACYVKAAHESQPSLSIKQDDFMPYESDRVSYAAGTYVSRPTLKYMIRNGHIFLQMAKQLQVLAKLKNNDRIFEDMLWIMGFLSMFSFTVQPVVCPITVHQFRSANCGVMQDRNIIAGGSQQAVIDYYSKKMFIAVQKTTLIMTDAFNKLRNDKLKTKFFRCTFNESGCWNTEAEEFFIVVYNPLCWTVTRPIRLPVLNRKHTVYNHRGQAVKAVLLRIPTAVLNLPQRRNKAQHELTFMAEYLPPLGYRSYFIASEKRTMERQRRSIIKKLKRNKKKKYLVKQTNPLKIDEESLLDNMDEDYEYFDEDNKTPKDDRDNEDDPSHGREEAAEEGDKSTEAPKEGTVEETYTQAPEGGLENATTINMEHNVEPTDNSRTHDKYMSDKKIVLGNKSINDFNDFTADNNKTVTQFIEEKDFNDTSKTFEDNEEASGKLTAESDSKDESLNVSNVTEKAFPKIKTHNFRDRTHHGDSTAHKVENGYDKLSPKLRDGSSFVDKTSLRHTKTFAESSNKNSELFTSPIRDNEEENPFARPERMDNNDEATKTATEGIKIAKESYKPLDETEAEPSNSSETTGFDVIKTNSEVNTSKMITDKVYYDEDPSNNSDTEDYRDDFGKPLFKGANFGDAYIDEIFNSTGGNEPAKNTSDGAIDTKAEEDVAYERKSIDIGATTEDKELLDIIEDSDNDKTEQAVKKPAVETAAHTLPAETRRMDAPVEVKPAENTPLDDISENQDDYYSRVSEDLFIENKYIRLNLNKRREIDSLVLLNGVTISLDIGLFYYVSEIPNKEPKRGLDHNPGANIFRLEDGRAVPVKRNSHVTIFKTDLVEEMHCQVAEFASFVLRIYEDKPYLEIDWVVGPVSVADGLGKEVFLRYTTDLKNDGVFYTDANGRQTMKRIRNRRATYDKKLFDHISGNIYPVTSKIYIEDLVKNVRVSVLNDRAQGGASLNDGQIEIFLHRRILTDDMGAGVLVNETFEGKEGIVVRGTHYIYVSKADYKPNKIFEKKFAKEIQLSPQVFVSQAYPYAFYSMPVWDTHRNEFSALNKKLPLGVHLLTIEQWNGGTLLMRFENYLENADVYREGLKKVYLKDLFVHLKIYSAKETTLAGNIWLKEYARKVWNRKEEFYKSFNDAYSSSGASDEPESGPEPLNTFKEVDLDAGISLRPQQIRTFVITFSYYSLN